MRKLRFKLSVLILASLASVPALANSVSYSFTTTIMVGSTPQSFSGQMTWDPLLRLIKATSFAFNFNGANVGSCTGSCPLLVAVFGSGNYQVGIGGLLNLNNQSFVLTVTDPTAKRITLQPVNVIWAAVAVPEVSSGVQLVIVVITLICAVFRSPLLRRPA